MIDSCLSSPCFYSINNWLKPNWNDRNHLWEKCIWCVLWLYILAHVPSADMEGAGFMTYTGTSHQGAIQMLRLHFWGAVMLSILKCSLWSGLSVQRTLWVLRNWDCEFLTNSRDDARTISDLIYEHIHIYSWTISRPMVIVDNLMFLLTMFSSQLLNVYFTVVIYFTTL